MARTATRAANASASPPHNTAAATGTKTPPARTIRYRNVRASIWIDDIRGAPIYSVTFSPSDQDDQDADGAANFNKFDLPLLSKLANDCYSWIEWQNRHGRMS